MQIRASTELLGCAFVQMAAWELMFPLQCPESDEVCCDSEADDVA